MIPEKCFDVKCRFKPGVAIVAVAQVGIRNLRDKAVDIGHIVLKSANHALLRVKALQHADAECKSVVSSHHQVSEHCAALKDQAVLLEQYKQRLIAVQHDLRAPCNTLLRTVQILESGTITLAEQRYLRTQLEPLVTLLRARIDALFDDAKAPVLKNRHDLPRLDLNTVVGKHMVEIRRLANIHATAQSPYMEPVVLFQSAPDQCFVQGRISEIQRILENLVSNSVAAGAQHIRLSVDLLAEHCVELVVEDTGSGFPTSMLSKGLQPTFTQHRGGTGLGLIGVAANVAAFHGTLHLENWSGGARVRIQFPRVIGRETQHSNHHYV